MPYIIILLVSFFFNISSSFSNNEKLIRITIYPSLIERGIVGSSTKIINNNTIRIRPTKHLVTYYQNIQGYFLKIYTMEWIQNLL